MYCPKCLNDSVSLSSKGVVDLIINKKQRDSGRILFSLSDEGKKQFRDDLEDKMEEFFEWYSQLQHAGPITAIDLVTSNFQCRLGCKFPPGQTLPVTDDPTLITRKEVVILLKEFCDDYNFPLNL